MFSDSAVRRLNGTGKPSPHKSKTRVHFRTTGNLRAAPPKPQVALTNDDPIYTAIGGDFHERRS